ncbi:lytic polysaccharide monooxygenase [Lentithecium fluviatile CBS 122367]|uniref:lytic cellulose monooxygenase (C4-dehydrogenating) n=1 Tax=Lentithecium fluviatile CBS 122367 TaxID=1168545 RepID=A0A6G1J4D9_9PLEO|nr:lytic polysaccharide monooxygenase [Lentithecium fluviatile CBS 122367]
MKTFASLSLFSLIASEAHAHYIFSHLILNGEVTPEFKYVRDVVVEPGFNYAENDIKGKFRPNENFDSEAMACGREAARFAATTQTADVIAGQEIGFRLSKQMEGTTFDQIFHDGPAQAYLARAPNEDLVHFNGTDGKWFKIASITTAHDTTPNPDFWITYRKNTVNFIIPKATPPGKYLLRIEHFMDPQFYVSCAHVNIIGEGGGHIPADYPYATFPGTYKYDDPAIHLDWSIWNKPGALLKYVGPGPAVWTGETVKRGVEFKA